MTRRHFIKTITTGAIAFVAGFLAFGCGKKETPKEEKAAEPEMTDGQKKEYVLANGICGKCPS